MTIKIWQAYSCNNSSSFRVIARFTDAGTAADVAAELSATLAARVDPDGEVSPLQALATEYGFDWPAAAWGGPDDGLDVITAGDYLIVYHEHCLGLGPGLPTYLEKRGAIVGPEKNLIDIQMSVLFRAPPGLDPRLDDELEEMFDQLAGKSDRAVAPLRAPWAFEHDGYGRASFFRDAGTVGLYFPTEPSDIVAVKAWLAGHGIEKVSIRLEEPADEQLFATLAAARCTACHGVLEYLDPRLHDIETPQLVCTPCGGLYELAVFTAP